MEEHWTCYCGKSGSFGGPPASATCGLCGTMFQRVDVREQPQPDPRDAALRACLAALRAAVGREGQAGLYELGREVAVSHRTVEHRAGPLDRARAIRQQCDEVIRRAEGLVR